MQLPEAGSRGVHAQSPQRLPPVLVGESWTPSGAKGQRERRGSHPQRQQIDRSIMRFRIVVRGIIRYHPRTGRRGVEPEEVRGGRHVPTARLDGLARGAGPPQEPVGRDRPLRRRHRNFVHFALLGRIARAPLTASRVRPPIALPRLA